MLREGRFVLPIADNQGRDLSDLVSKVIDEVASRFGGATITNSFGSWRHDGKTTTDPIYMFDVAYEPSVENDQAITAIAINAGIEAGQESVYIRLASGEVIIPHTKPAAVSAAA